MNKWRIILPSLAIGSLIVIFQKNDYTTDYGNGVTVYADRYVNTGEWVYNCKRSFLVSRVAKVFPSEHFKSEGEISIGPILLYPHKELIAKAFISAVIADKDWHAKLEYVKTGIDETSSLSDHYFQFTTDYEGSLWTISVGHPHDLNRDNEYSITAKPYDPATHMTHESALRESRISCPKPQ